MGRLCSINGGATIKRDALHHSTINDSVFVNCHQYNRCHREPRCPPLPAPEHLPQSPPRVKTNPQAANDAGAPPRKRIRLSPELRSQQILDAALLEFSRHGFSATRIEDIAHGAGLSKAGVYAHFSGKEQIFQALLARLPLPPILSEDSHDSATPTSTDQAPFARFVDNLYDQLSAPGMMSILRLVIAESGRCEHLIRQWRREALIPHHAQYKALIERAVASGELTGSVVVESSLLALAPAVFAAIHAMIFQEDANPQDLLAMRAAHKRMLFDALSLNRPSGNDAAPD